MIHGILHAGYGFYRLLPEGDQLTFQKRVQDYLKGRQFRTRTDKEISTEQKVMISASAIHATWGFRKFYYPYFNLITVFSEPYADVSVKRYGSQGLKMTGAIVVTLPEWEQAFSTEDPLPFQPGLHEYALAVYEENVNHGEGYAEIDITWIENEMGQHALLTDRLPADWEKARSATVTESQQWFATASEFFLGDPALFQEQFPTLYPWFTHIYQWDPMRVTGSQTSKNEKP